MTRIIGIPGIPLYDADLEQREGLPVLRTLGVRYWAGGWLLVSRANAAIGVAGEVRDETLRQQLAQFVASFAAFAAAAATRG
jgi:hypothetical protein